MFVLLVQNLLSLLLWKYDDDEKDICIHEPDILEPKLNKTDIHYLRKKHISDSCILFYDHEPLQIVRARGQYMYDEKDNQYLDCINNVCHVGHCHPYVVKAGQRQMGLLNTNSRYLSELNSRYAQRLTATFPEELDTVFFMNSGSETTDFALELCRVWTGATDFICVDSGYHGHTRAATQVSNYKYSNPKGIGQPDFVQQMDLPDIYRGQYRDPDTAGYKYAGQAGQLIEKIYQRGSKVAGFIGESMLSCGGQIILPEGYLRTIYETVRKEGGLCIADEVQVGFGRCGTGMWVFSEQGVVPDIVTIGKPMGNGHPISAVVCKRAIADKYYENRPEYFNTYGGNPVSMAIGLAVLDVIRNERLIEHARVTGSKFLEELEILKTKHQCIGDVRGLGLFLGIEFVKDRHTREPDERTAVAIKQEMYKDYIIVSTEGRYNNIVKIKPPMTFDALNVKHFIQHFDKAISKVVDQRCTVR